MAIQLEEGALLSWDGSEDIHCSVSVPAKGEKLFSLFTAAQNGRMLAKLGAMDCRATPVFMQRPKRSRSLKPGDRVLARLDQQDLRMGQIGAKHIDARVVAVHGKRKKVELAYVKGENILVDPNDVVLWDDVKEMEAKNADLTD